jgi:signal transduction histidine kinase
MGAYNMTEKNEASLSTQFEKRIRGIAQFWATAAGGVAALAWLCWGFDQWRLTTFGADYVPMAPSTALLFLLLSGAMFARNRWPAAATTRRFINAVVVVVVLVSLLVWATWLLGVKMPIEEWMGHTVATVKGIPVGRMSLATAKVFLLVALALLFDQPAFAGNKLFRRMAIALSLLVIWIGLLVLTGYAAGVPFFYGGGPVTPMALLTSVAFILLGLGAFVSSASNNWLLRMFVLDSWAAMPTRHGRFGLRLPSSLQGRFLLLGVIAGVAGAGAISWIAVERYEAAKAEATKNNLHLTRLIANQLERLIVGERYLLLALSQVPAIRNLDAAASSALLAEVKKELPPYGNFSMFTTSGEIFASAIPIQQSFAVSHRPWFQRALRTRGFSVGELQIGTLSHVPVMVVAHSILDDAGRVLAVLNSSLDLTFLDTIIEPNELPPGATLFVIDRKGTVLMHYPEPEKWVGRDMAEDAHAKMIFSRRQGMTEVSDADGIERTYFFMPVDGADDGIFISLGIPKSTAFAGIRRQFVHGLFGLGLIGGIVVVLLLWLAEVSILRPVNSLVSTARRLAGGDLSARTGQPYGEGELEQLRSTFDDMADALQQREAERKQAEEKLKASQVRIRQLAQRLEMAREEEHTHFADELHDELGQILSAIKIDLAVVAAECPREGRMKEIIGETQRLLSEGILGVHALCHELRPGALDDLGLKEALTGLVEDWKRRNQTECDFWADIDDEVLTDKIRTAAFRIVQEALNNVSSHARASKVEVNLVADEQTLRFSVADNGCGMEPGTESKPTSFGLLRIRERLEALSGELHIESSPGRGTRLEATIPLPPKG